MAEQRPNDVAGGTIWNRKLVAPLLGALVSIACVAIASWLLHTHTHTHTYASLPFGLLVCAAVTALLAGDGLVTALDRLRARRRARSAPNEHPAAERVCGGLWHTLTHAQVTAVLEVPEEAASHGLAVDEARRRLSAYGPNTLSYRFMPSLWRTLLKEIHEAQQVLLLVLAVLYAFIGEVEEAALALAVIVLMAIAEVLTEYRAKRAMSSLQHSTPEFARVVRDGTACTVPREQLVPGDLVLLKAGYEVPADVRLLQLAHLQCNESRLTGESVPVAKHAVEVLEADTPLADRNNMAYAGTIVTRGRGKGIVVATGEHSELGAVLASVRAVKTKERKTALQKLLKRVAGILTYVALAGSVLGALLGLVRGQQWQEIVLTALSLAFATIPEELPILIAAVLAVGAQALTKHNVFVKRLRALEALAYVDTVLTDKTGTLTQNKLVLVEALMPTTDALQPFASVRISADDVPPSEPRQLDEVVEAWYYMADDSSMPSHLFAPSAPRRIDHVAIGIGEAAPQTSISDPFDGAVLAALRTAGYCVPPVPNRAVGVGISDASEARQLTLVQDWPFDPESKMAARVFSVASADSSPSAPILAFIKGAPEAVAARCGTLQVADNGPSILMTLGDAAAENTVARADVSQAVERAAAGGFRLVAYAVARLTQLPTDLDSVAGASLLGILCFDDPLRPEAADAVRVCQAAGIHVAMVTGDHPQAATAIALRCGILGAAVASAGAINSSVYHCGLHAVQPAASEGISDTREAALFSAAARHASVYARATPDQKLTLVHAHQQLGHVVAVTGDGVNDAPALAAADIGIAVQDATDVAREAAAVVVVGGDFTSLPRALQEGRRLFDNLVHALAFYLGAKLGLLLLFIAGTVWKGFPLAPVQVIVLELFMDLGASSSFVAEPAERGIMQRPPRHVDERFFNAIMLARIAAGGLSMASAVLGGYAFGLVQHEGNLLHAQSMAFICWLMAHVTLAFNQRTAVEPVLLAKDLTTNRVFIVWIFSVLLLAVLVGTVLELDAALALTPLTAREWGIAVGICLASTFWMEAVKLMLHTCRAQRL